MINFPCKCGYAFELPSDQAGGLIQCPECGLLADVPLLSDISSIKTDGTFEFEESEPASDPVTAADLHRVYTNRTVDSQGREKDLRPSIHHDRIQDEHQKFPVRVAPRYDPETGQLIRPLALKDEQPQPVIAIGVEVDPTECDEEAEAALPVIPVATKPRARPRQLGYAVGDTRKHITLTTLAMELLMPANAAVMFFIMLFCIAAHFITLGIVTLVDHVPVLIAWPFLIANLPIWWVIAHVGCIIEDTGPDAVDELPRPMRNFGFFEDFLSPLFRTLLAAILCFWPLALAYRLPDESTPIFAAMTALVACTGAFIFPAVLLTTIAGTTILNLRPDRIAAVIRLCGLQYFVSVILFVLTIVPIVFYLMGDLMFRQQLNGKFFKALGSPVGLVLLPMIGVYLLHFFSWHLGILYRDHHEQFPWLAQRHVKRNEIDVAA